MFQLLNTIYAEKKKGDWLTIRALVKTVNTQSWVVGSCLLCLDFSQCFNGRQARVLCKSKRSGIQSICKCTHGILFDGRDLYIKSMSVSMGSLMKERKIHTSSATLATAKEQLISAAPPPYTTRLSRTKLRTAQMASCNDRFASSIIYSIVLAAWIIV